MFSMDSFIAVDDDGNELVIRKVSVAGDVSATLMTDDGRHVTRIAKGAYQIIDGNDVIYIWSGDPDAP